MADWTQVEVVPADFAPGAQEVDSHEQTLAFSGGGGPSVVQKYKMRAQDDGVPLPGYVTWQSTDNPDFAGVGFAGGIPAPVGIMIPGSAVIADEWEE